MKAAVLTATGSLSAQQWPRPQIGAGELLLRLRGCGLCGSDIAEFVRVPAANARHATFGLPAHVSDEAASFVEPLACCLRAVKRAGVEEGDTAVVVGLGSIGCLFVQLLKRRRAFAAGLDVLPARVAFALGLGADAAGDAPAVAAAVRRASADRGADHVFITGGGTAVLPWAATVLRDGGTIQVFAGGGGEALPLALNALYARELTVTATYSSSPVELREAFDLIAGGAVRTAELISHRVSLAQLAEGVALVQRREALKVYVTP